MNKRRPPLRLAVDCTPTLALALLSALAAWPAAARVVGVGEGQGNAYLFHHRGNCYAILPTHVHGRGPMQLSGRDPAGIGTAHVIDRSNSDIDLSLALVSGSLTQSCGGPWSDLPQRLSIRPNEEATVVRVQQGSVETIRSHVAHVDFTQFSLAPDGDETRFFAAGTSGATVLQGGTPIGMVLTADSRDLAYALRMDEIQARLRRVIEDWFVEGSCTEGDTCGEVPDLAAQSLSGFQLSAWQPHGVTADTGADAMVSGSGAYIAPIARGEPVTLTFESAELREIRRVVMTSRADGQEAHAPKLVKVMIDAASGVVANWRAFKAPTEMAPGQALDLRRGGTFARRIRIEVHSAWGGSPVRIDSIAIE